MLKTTTPLLMAASESEHDEHRCIVVVTAAPKSTRERLGHFAPGGPGNCALFAHMRNRNSLPAFGNTVSADDFITLAWWTLFEKHRTYSSSNITAMEPHRHFADCSTLYLPVRRADLSASIKIGFDTMILCSILKRSHRAIALAPCRGDTSGARIPLPVRLAQVLVEVDSLLTSLQP